MESELKLLTVAVLLFFMNKLRSLQIAHHQRIFDWPIEHSSERQLKMLLILLVAYNFMNFMINIQNMYTNQIKHRLPIEAREIIKRNIPEPRTIMYYERTFTNLCNLLGPLMAPNVDASAAGRPNTPIEKQILPVLWLLATPESYRSVADRFDISKGTLVLFVNRLVDNLNEMSSRFIKWPEPHEMASVRKTFYKIARFDEWVIAAVDGAYVVIPAPKDDPEVFRTRKSNFAVTLQGICTATLHFISCFAGYPASVGDRRIFENSPIYRSILHCKNKYFPTNEFMIGDKAYPVTEWLQAPYIRRFALNESQELYNHLLSATRQVIERAFGLLFGRFRRLKFLDMHKCANIPKTIVACCVLHNMCLAEQSYEDFIQEGMPDVIENITRDVDENSCYDRNTAASMDGELRRGRIAATLHRRRISQRQ